MILATKDITGDCMILHHHLTLALSGGAQDVFTVALALVRTLARTSNVFPEYCMSWAAEHLLELPPDRQGHVLVALALTKLSEPQLVRMGDLCLSWLEEIGTSDPLSYARILATALELVRRQSHWTQCGIDLIKTALAASPGSAVTVVVLYQLIRVLARWPEAAPSPDRLWNTICTWLLHPHSRVRDAARELAAVMLQRGAHPPSLRLSLAQLTLAPYTPSTLAVVMAALACDGPALDMAETVVWVTASLESRAASELPQPSMAHLAGLAVDIATFTCSSPTPAAATRLANCLFALATGSTLLWEHRLVLARGYAKLAASPKTRDLLDWTPPPSSEDHWLRDLLSAPTTEKASDSRRSLGNQVQFHIVLALSYRASPPPPLLARLSVPPFPHSLAEHVDPWTAFQIARQLLVRPSSTIRHPVWYQVCANTLAHLCVMLDCGDARSPVVEWVRHLSSLAQLRQSTKARSNSSSSAATGVDHVADVLERARAHLAIAQRGFANTLLATDAELADVAFLASTLSREDQAGGQLVADDLKRQSRRCDSVRSWISYDWGEDNDDARQHAWVAVESDLMDIVTSWPPYYLAFRPQWELRLFVLPESVPGIPIAIKPGVGAALEVFGQVQSSSSGSAVTLPTFTHGDVVVLTGSRPFWQSLLSDDAKRHQVTELVVSDLESRSSILANIGADQFAMHQITLQQQAFTLPLVIPNAMLGSGAATGFVHVALMVRLSMPGPGAEHWAWKVHVMVYKVEK
ncbi:hypothetical protein BC828DRAFT_395140 [Blastocladiella britannica]|nr:hypothetical protein BC828DRAFT_395140 [Blastocladiella britannica]